MNDQLKEARAAFTKSGQRELYTLQDNPAVAELWQDRQNIISEMNREISEAISQVRAKYQPQLDDADTAYAFYLQMITPTKDE